MRRRTEAVRPSTNPDPAAFLPLPNLPYLVMLSIAEQPRHGWAIVKRIEELSGPRATPSSGSLYLAIARLEERGLIEESPAPDESVDQRRTYRLTSLGRRVVRLETVRLAELVGLAKRWLGPEDDR